MFLQGYMEREWFKMRNIPGVTVLDGSVSNRAHLRAAGINKVDLWIKLYYRTLGKYCPNRR